MFARGKMINTDQQPNEAVVTLLSQLRGACAVAIEAYKCAAGSKQLAILMVVYRLQDHIALTRVSDMSMNDEDDKNAWVDRWRPE